MDSKKVLTGFIVGTILGILAILISWLLGSESSPFYEYFLYNVALKNVWMLLIFPAYVVTILTGASSFGAVLFIVFFQWFLIGFFVAWFIGKVITGRSRTN